LYDSHRVPKVLLVSPVGDIGGGEVVLLNLVRFRERQDLEYAALIISDSGGPLAAAFDECGVPSARVARGRMANPFGLRSTLAAIRGEIDRLKPDVVLANSSQGYLYARWAAGSRQPTALYFMSVPDAVLWRNGILEILARWSPPDALLAASAAIQRGLEGCGFREVSMVHHGVPEPVARPGERAAVDARLGKMGVSPRAPMVLMPGRLQRWKGQMVFVRAFAEVARACPDAHGVCLGDALFGRETGFRDELHAEIRRLGLEGRMHLPGQDAIAPWLERAACVIHASTQPDAFPNVCIEALASRRPLITNTACGVAEILIAGRDAWVVPPSDEAALSGAIIDALRDRRRAAAVAEAGYRAYQEHCTPSHMVRPIERVLVDLAGKSRR
jgi:glycosyltransferase involved in cell wall biosynthesis